MNEYKGIYYNDNNEQHFYEGGAHFRYRDLCDRLERLHLYISKKRGSSQQKPKTRNTQQPPQISQVQHQNNTVNILNNKFKKQPKLSQTNTRNIVQSKKIAPTVSSKTAIKKTIRNISMDINQSDFKKKTTTAIKQKKNNNISNSHSTNNGNSNSNNTNTNNNNEDRNINANKNMVDYSIKVKTHSLLSNNTNSTSTCSGTKTNLIQQTKKNNNNNTTSSTTNHNVIKKKTQTRNILNNRGLSGSSCMTVTDYITSKKLMSKTFINNCNLNVANESNHVNNNNNNTTNKKSRNAKHMGILLKNSVDKNKTCSMLSHIRGTFKASRNNTKPKEMMNKTAINASVSSVNPNSNTTNTNNNNNNKIILGVNTKLYGIGNYCKITLHKPKPKIKKV